jgi:hypothetical protein
VAKHEDRIAGTVKEIVGEIVGSDIVPLLIVRRSEGTPHVAEAADSSIVPAVAPMRCIRARSRTYLQKHTGGLKTPPE